MKRLVILSSVLFCLLSGCEKDNELEDVVIYNPHENLDLPHIEVIRVADIDCNNVAITVKVLEENIPDSISYSSVYYEDPFGKSFWTVRTENVRVQANCGGSSTYKLALYNRFSKTIARKMEYTYTP